MKEQENQLKEWPLEYPDNRVMLRANGNRNEWALLKQTNAFLLQTRLYGLSRYGPIKQTLAWLAKEAGYHHTGCN